MKHLTEDLGSSYEVLTDSLKAFPTILCSHTPIQGTVQLMKAKNLRLEDVDAIHFRVTPTAPGQGMNYSPDSALSARLSIPYCVSRAAADGYVAMDQFQDEKIKEPRVQAFMKRVTLESVPGVQRKISRDPGGGAGDQDQGRKAVPGRIHLPQRSSAESHDRRGDQGKIPPPGVEYPGPNPDRPDHRNGLSGWTS